MNELDAGSGSAEIVDPYVREPGDPAAAAVGDTRLCARNEMIPNISFNPRVSNGTRRRCMARTSEKACRRHERREQDDRRRSRARSVSRLTTVLSSTLA